MAELSPMMQQYFKIKEETKDFLLATKAKCFTILTLVFMT